MPAPPYISAAHRRVASHSLRRRAAGGTNTTLANMSTGGKRSRLINYKYPFPSIPRPKRNLLYYNPMSTLKRGFFTFPYTVIRKSTKPLGYLIHGRTRRSPDQQGLLNGQPSQKRRYGVFNMPFRFRNKNQKQQQQRRYFSANPKGKKRVWPWFTIPILSFTMWSVLRRKSDMDDVPKLAKPWQVAAYSTLPLKAMSRLWGRFNDINLPMWMREPGFKLYSYVFGVNLDEVAENDLRTYSNLGEFFYRELKPGVRPIDENSILVSPADGKVLQVGVIRDGKVEQVKGVTYSLDALLGSPTTNLAAPRHDVDFERHDVTTVLEREKDFAIVNGISYKLDDLIGSGDSKVEKEGEATVKGTDSATVMSVSKDLLVPDVSPASEKELFYAVIYLAPGDYHRFHSPTNWVAQLRRHFVGELYSVAPYFQNRLHGLFCLNERVALLGKWKYGFFSMTPVGATNVGSIRLHFDKDLRTNNVFENIPSSSLTQSTTSLASESSDLPAEESTSSISSSSISSSSARKRVQKATCYEATYNKASRLLGGYPLVKGEQMGGFNLGSTVVLVFEAPKTFQFSVKAGETVQVGEAFGNLA